MKVTVKTDGLNLIDISNNVSLTLENDEVHKNDKTK